MIGQYEQLKADIAEVIRENGRQEITGDILQQVLLGMVGELGGGATFAGIAEPQPRAEALTPDNDVFYLVFDKGLYGQFGGIEVTDTGMLGVVYIKDGEWTLATYGEQEARVTYGELLSMVQSARLTSGKVYRITDYETVLSSDITTAQSAGHVFDVLVTAVAENALSEDARAIHHDEETYFGGSQLKSWVLKYSLFNDPTRFGWAAETNGKGVIYFMRDEFGNECGYDFKNIQFKRWNVTDSVEGRNVNGYMGVLDNLAEGLTIDDEDDWRWAYTFDSNGVDASLKVVGNVVALDNVIGETMDWKGKRSLAGNVFYGQARKNVLGYNCDNNTFHEADDNTLGNECDANAIMTMCMNTIGNGFLGNSGVLLQNNTMGNSVYLNKWKTIEETNIGNVVNCNAWENVQYSTIGNSIESTVIESSVGYVQILDGVSGTLSSPIAIPFVAGTDSQCAGMIGGAVKVWKPAELVLAVVEIEGATTYTLNAVVGKFYRFEQAEVLNLVLPVPDSTEVERVLLGVPFGGGASLTVTSEADVRYQDGFSIEEMTTYEINCLWNGLRWVVAAMKIAEA